MSPSPSIATLSPSDTDVASKGEEGYIDGTDRETIAIASAFV